MTLLRIVLFAGLLAAGAVVDGAWLSRLPGWASPDLLLLVAVAFGLRRGVEAGALAGAVAGYLRDVTGGGPLGVFALSYLAVGTAAGALAALVDLGQRYLYAAAAALATVGLSLVSGLAVTVTGLMTVDWPLLLREAAAAAAVNALFARPVAAAVAWAESSSRRRDSTKIVARRALR
ncbi:MAG: rod shape-determining protein MreD [Armatimonadetes bacterium]|nr:rod shape-determining protein MreD [Armatimonadota bacterium]